LLVVSSMPATNSLMKIKQSTLAAHSSGSLTFPSARLGFVAGFFRYKRKQITMKKFITLLIAFGAFAVAQAQTSRDEARRVILGQPKDNGQTSRSGDVVYDRNGYPTNPNTSSSQQAEIDQVNRDYDAKIYSIRNNPNLSQAEKDRMISQLERDRKNRIREINKRYQGSNGQYDKRRNNDRDDRDERYGDRKDNGKHLGWEKGKGNPHKNGGKPGKGSKSKDKSWKDRDDD
jgi:hypothetical protein